MDLIEQTTIMLSQMVERETRCWGDQGQAYARVGRSTGLSARAIRRIINRETKDPGIYAYSRVLTAYRAQTEALLRTLNTQFETAKRAESDVMMCDVEEKVAELMEEIRQAQKGGEV
jgi:hypothetical protein